MYCKSKIVFVVATILIALAATSAISQDAATTPMRGPDVVYVGTPYDILSRMLQLANPKKSEKIYDLGCGDARMLVLAAQKYGMRGVGYDIDPERINDSLRNVERNNVGSLVRIIQADVFTLDLSEADVISLYLLPEMNLKLLPQLEKMKPGSRIVCNEYGLEGIIPDKVEHVTCNEDNHEHTLMLYTTPLKRY